ncbi:MAG: bifunctional diguanylate cyclase/phosphodiesterase, partial [Actinomycetota bacterium]|nr:bifunctional diguanylate cyclase/phosphodiesterase [Actinomycetota bacterium]
SVGLLFCDLEGFKGVNDQLGHSAGDDLLMLVADRFRSSVRPSDTVARFGGDEFVVLCSDLRHADDAVAVADRLRTAFDEPFQLGGTSVSTSASIGIAVGAGGTAAPDDLLRRADQAMYEAKASGKARHVVYELTHDEEERTRSERAAEVRKAIDRHELSLHYQPIVELDGGRVAGHEAYVRWHHPIRGELRPQELIDIATSAGLAAEVDLWVLGVALDELAPWRCPAGSGPSLETTDKPVWTSVNLTPGSLATPEFAARVSEVLQSRDSRASSIVLEVSEAALSGEPGTVLSTLDELHDLGVGLAIDDFGTGHSSLDRLRRCPIDTIKIHQTLVHGLVADDDDRSAVQAIIAMAEALDLDVIAEGVETDEQLAVLKTLGCRTAQGYLLASPVPIDELAVPPHDASG